jgi:hypothetical protein
LWKPSADSTEAYVLLSRRRAQLRLKTSWLALGLVVAQLVVARLASVPSSFVQWVAAVAWLAWAIWLHRRATSECRRLDGVLAELRRSAAP